MVRFVFSVEDLALTHFAISPMWELVHSVLALRDQSHAALHLPWLRSLSGRLHGLPLERVAALNPPRGYSPDFLVPLPSGPLGDIDDDLAALRATPVAQFARTWRCSPPSTNGARRSPRRTSPTRGAKCGVSLTCSRLTGAVR